LVSVSNEPGPRRTLDSVTNEPAAGRVTLHAERMRIRGFFTNVSDGGDGLIAYF
jgi:hypothetical protein